MSGPVFALEDGHGTRLCTGLDEHVARRTAQSRANELQIAVYLYDESEPDTVEEFLPTDLDALEQPPNCGLACTNNRVYSLNMPKTNSTTTATTITDDQIEELQSQAWERNDGTLSALCSHALRPDDGSTIIVCADTITDKEYTRHEARQACADALNARLITSSEVRTLRDEAAATRDPVTFDLCEIVLSGEDSDGFGTTLGTPCTVEQARAQITATIEYNRARDDSEVES